MSMIFTRVISILLTGSLAVVTASPDELDEKLPFIGDLIECAYPTWCIDKNENRIFDVETCEDGTPNGKWSPLYLTKEHSGADPALGGYPTNIDIKYAFEFAAPFLGQPCAGSPHHCPIDWDPTMNCKKCPKLNLKNDNGYYGPGHVPPHISLAAITWAFKDRKKLPGNLNDVSTWFDFDAHACRIIPDVLLKLIRVYFPRKSDGSVKYPPPFTKQGGAYPLEFVNLAGESCQVEADKHGYDISDLDCFENHSGPVSLFPEYLMVGHGSPHFCTTEGKECDVNPDYCPYIFFGPNRGKYRHPHIAFSAVEVYLANKLMPDKCGPTWDDSDYPLMPNDSTVAFSDMSEVTGFPGHPEQPTIYGEKCWKWPGSQGNKTKPVQGLYAMVQVVVKPEPDPTPMPTPKPNSKPTKKPKKTKSPKVSKRA